MKRLSIKSALICAVVLTVFGTMLASAGAKTIPAPLTLELDLAQLPTGQVPSDGLAYNSFLTISSPDEDASIIDGDDDFANGAIGLFPGHITFEFAAERVQVLSFRYEVFNNNASSIADARGSAGSGFHVHPDGLSVQSFEGIGDISSVEMEGLESVAGNIVIEFTGNAPDDDSDGDGVQDAQDNCLVVANADQRDTDGDGFGNRCDFDLNNDNIVNFLDVALFRDAFQGGPNLLNADFDGDNDVDFVDFEYLKDGFLGVPGPSAPVIGK